MNRSATIIGVLLICLGIAGVALLAFLGLNGRGLNTGLAPAVTGTSGNGAGYTNLMRHLMTDYSKESYASPGERIYLSATGKDGSRLQADYSGSGMPARGMMSRHIACVNCHGIDGKGGFLFPDGTTTSADVRWSALSKEGFDQASFNQAITKGVDEKGQSLSYWMPRWTIDESGLIDLTAYLKTL